MIEREVSTGNGAKWAWLGAAALVLTGLAASFATRGPVRPGLRERCLAADGRVLVERTLGRARSLGPSLHAETAVVEWDGEIAVPETCVVDVQLVATAKTSLRIGGHEVARTTGGSKQDPRYRMRLSTGRHAIELRSELREGDRATWRTSVHWTRWDLPEATGPKRRPLPPSALFHGRHGLSSSLLHRLLSLSTFASCLCLALPLLPRGMPRRIGAVLLVAGLMSFQADIRSDGLGYYAYVRSAVLDGDLDFGNDFALRTATITPIQAEHLRPAAGRPPNMWAIGAPLTRTPAFVAAHVASLLMSPWLPTPADGTGTVYTALFCFMPALYGVTALGIIGGALSTRFSDATVAAALLLTFFGTPLYYYTFLSHGIVHAEAALYVTVFLLSWARHGKRALALMAVAYGLAVLTYWQLGLLALLPMAELLLALARRDRARARRTWRKLLLLSAALVVFAIPQLLAWKSVMGRYLTVPQGRHFLEGSFATNLFLTFVSPFHGLLLWTPLLLVAIPYAAAKSSPSWVKGGVFLLVVLALHNASILDWAGGHGFGLRRLTSVVLATAFGLASAWQRGRTIAKAVLVAGALPTLGLALLTRAGAFADWSEADHYTWRPENYPRLVRDAADAFTHGHLGVLFGRPLLFVVAAMAHGRLAMVAAWTSVLLASAAVAAGFALGWRVGGRLAADPALAESVCRR